MKSMTGYGKCTACNGNVEVTAEVRSVNSKALRVRYHIPNTFNCLIDRLNRTLSRHISRGDVDVYITCRFLKEPAVTVNLNEVLPYIKAVKKLKGLTGETISLSLADLLNLPEAFLREELDPEALERVVLECLECALDRLNRMRKAEGERIRSYLKERLENVRLLIKRIEARANKVSKQAVEKLRAKLKELSGSSAPDALTERVELEVSLILERQDVSEELARLKSHAEQFESLIHSGAPVGKTLDFLCQELLREANTVAGKLRDTQVVRAVVELKTEVARMKEQVQNVE